MTFNPHDHEHDEHDRCLDSEGQPIVLAEVASKAQPQWLWSWWEVPAVLASMLAGAGQVLDRSMGYLSREFIAAANLSRTKRIAIEQEAHMTRRREQIADDIRRLQEGDPSA